MFAGARQLLWEKLKESRYEFDYLICLNRVNVELNCPCLLRVLPALLFKGKPFEKGKVGKV